MSAAGVMGGRGGMGRTPAACAATRRVSAPREVPAPLPCARPRPRHTCPSPTDRGVRGGGGEYHSTRESE